MYKIRFAVLLLGLTFLAASCNILDDTLGLASGQKGVFRSDDAGRSFKPANKVGQNNDALGGTSVNTLVMDPGNRDVLYLGSSSGIYKTEDGGNNWRFILTQINVYDIAIDPFKTDILYAVGVSGGKGKIIRSDDAGSSWIDLYTEPTSANAVTSIVVSATNPLVVIASLNTGEIIRSSDEGQTWQIISETEDRVLRLKNGTGNSIYVLTAKRGVFKTADNGNTFTQLTRGITGTGFIDFSSEVPTVTSFHDLALDLRSAGVLYLGTEQGLVRSVNDGQSWAFLNMPVKNTLLRTSAVAVNPANSNNLFAVVGSTMFKSMNGGVTWETRELPSGQEVRSILINPESVNVMFLGLGNRR